MEHHALIVSSITNHVVIPNYSYTTDRDGKETGRGKRYTDTSFQKFVTVTLKTYSPVSFPLFGSRPLNR